MHSPKVLLVTEDPNSPIQNFLQSFAPAIGFIDPSQKESILKQWPKPSDANVIYTEPQLSPQLLEKAKEVPANILEIKAFDTLIFRHGRWWMHCFFRQALHSLIIERSGSLDTKRRAYVSGLSPLTPLVFSVLFQLGFRNLSLVTEDTSSAQGVISTFQRLHFDSKIICLKQQDLLVQDNDGSILINQIRVEREQSWAESLSYLNFLGALSLVVDVDCPPSGNVLIEEAKSVGLKTLTGAEIKALSLYYFLQELGLASDKEPKDFLTTCLTELSQNSPKV